MRVVAMLFGLLLLLPGACALVFAVYSVPEFIRGPSNGDAIPFILLWAVCGLGIHRPDLLKRRSDRRRAP